MKKTVKSISLLAFALLLSACGDSIATQETSDSLTLESEYIAENAQLSEDNEPQTVELEINTSDWVLADSMIYVPSDWYQHWDPWGTQFFDTSLPDNTMLRVERQLIPRMYFEIRLGSIYTSDFLFNDGQMGELIQARELVAWLYDEETAFIFWHRGNLNYFADNFEILTAIARTLVPTSEDVESYFEQNVVESDLLGQWVVVESLDHHWFAVGDLIEFFSDGHGAEHFGHSPREFEWMLVRGQLLIFYYELGIVLGYYPLLNSEWHFVDYGDLVFNLEAGPPIILSPSEQG